MKTPVVALPVEKGTAVQGVVKAHTVAPAPGSVPYKDCVVAVTLQVTKVVSGKVDAQEILVYTWGLRDNRLVNTGIENGKTLTIKLTPWADAEGAYGGINRVEPTDDASLFLDAYWGEVR